MSCDREEEKRGRGWSKTRKRWENIRGGKVIKGSTENWKERKSNENENLGWSLTGCKGAREG